MGSGQTAQVVLTVDVAIVRPTWAGYSLLLIQRGKAPYQGMWALPGGKLDVLDHSLEAAAYREVQEETGLSLVSGLQQVATFGAIDRDPRGRYVSVLYLAVVPADAPLFVRAGDDAASASWFFLSALPSPLAFDHDLFVRTVTNVLQWEA